MKILVAKEALECLKSVDMGLCESCVMGKQKRVSFTKTPREPKKVRLEMVHTDVCEAYSFLFAHNTALANTHINRF